MAQEDKKASLTESISNLSITVYALRSAIEQYSNENLRQKAISINSSLVEQINRNTEVISDMPGRLAGNLETAIQAQIAGLQGYDKNMALLASEMRFSNQNAPGMIRALEENRISLQLSNESRNQLAKHTLNVADTYRIQTGVLVGTIQELTGLLGEFTGSRFAGPLQMAVTQLQGMLGPQYAKDLNSFVTELLNPSIDGMVEASKLGLQGIRQQIFKSRDSDEILTSLIKAIQKGSNKWDGIIAAGEHSADLGAQIGIFNSIFEEKLTNTASILQAGIDQGKKQLTLGELYNNTVAKLKDSFEAFTVGVFSDLLVAVADTGTLLLSVLNLGGGLVGRIVILGTAVGFLSTKILSLYGAIEANTAALHKSIISNSLFSNKLSFLGGFLGSLVKIGGFLFKWAGIFGMIFSIVELLSSLITGKGLFGLLFDKEVKVDKLEVKNIETEKEAKDYSDLFRGTADLLNAIMRDIITDTNDALVEETRLLREENAMHASQSLHALDKIGTKVIPQ